MCKECGLRRGDQLTEPCQCVDRWYVLGQVDACVWLRGAASEDSPLAPIDESIHLAWSMTCLGRNLRDAGMASAAFYLGRDAGVRQMWPCGRPHAWWPNVDGRMAPGWSKP